MDFMQTQGFEIKDNTLTKINSDKAASPTVYSSSTLGAGISKFDIEIIKQCSFTVIGIGESESGVQPFGGAFCYDLETASVCLHSDGSLWERGACAKIRGQAYSEAQTCRNKVRQQESQQDKRCVTTNLSESYKMLQQTDRPATTKWHVRHNKNR